MPEETHFEVGGLWDLPGWDLLRNHSKELRPPNDRVCPHAIPQKRAHWYTIPFVIVLFNEGGCCGAGACAECVRDRLNETIGGSA